MMGSIGVTAPRGASRVRASGLLALLLTFSAHGGEVNWGEEYAKRIKATENVSALGDGLFGDNINLFNGTVSFSATDISLPGNSALPVQLSRSYNLQDLRQLPPIGDWDIDAPYLGGTHPDRASVGHWAPLTRCTTVAAPAPITVGSYTFTSRDYWSGTQLHAGGSGGDLLSITTDAKLVKPATAVDYKWTTKAQWFFSCLPALKNSAEFPGEGFVGHAPDGTTYTFDYMVAASYPGITKKDPSTLTGAQVNRKSVRIYASKVQDRFGNWVQYDWSGGRLNRVWANDGREILLAYDAVTGLLSSATAAGHTWTYQYANRQLASVVNPDGSKWQFATSNADALKRVEYEYDLVTPEPGDYIRDDTAYCWPTNRMVQRTGSYTIAAPSGASATYSFAPTRHGRTNVKFLCMDGTDDNWRSDYNNFSLTHDTVSLQSKVVTGPGIAQQTYSYTYSNLDGGYRPTGDSQTDTLIEASAPPHYKYVTVQEPDGTQQIHHFGKDYELNEGRLLWVETKKAGVLYKTVTNEYITEAEIPSQLFPDLAGSNLVWFGDNHSAAAIRPIRQTTITQDGVSFTNRANDYDEQARTLGATKSSSPLGYSRTEVTEYHDDKSKWVLGQLKKKLVNGAEVSRTDFDANAQPWKIYDFTLLKQTLTYNTASGLVDPEAGTLKTVTDGNNNVTTLSTWKRGIPQLISHADGKSESAVVNNDGTIASVTDENGAGYTTSYTYDPMGRLKTITYPAGEGWADTNLSFAPTTTTTAAYGVPVGLWKQTVSTGVGIKAVYFDAMWRPVVEESFDNTNGTTATTTRSVSVKRYDTSGHPVFQSYPLNALGSYTDTTLKGSRTTFDALDRVTRVEQDDEPGEAPLVTETKYLSGFRTEVTNPRLFKTTTSYMAYDQPSTTWPVAIAHPTDAGTVASFTDITRDVYGKPLSVTRRNSTGSTKITRSYVYGGAQRLCIVTEPETGSTVSVFDGADNLDRSASGLVIPSGTSCSSAKALADASGRVVHRTYDARNRITSLSFPDGRGNTTHTYTDDGLPETIAVDNGGGNVVTTTYSYNKRRLPTREVLDWTSAGINWPIDYTYNANGHLASQVWHGITVDYAPNALGQATKAGIYASGVSYHPNGAIKQFTYGNNIVHTLEQNARGLPDRSKDVYGATAVLDDSYVYDPNGNVASILDALPGNRGNRTMTYDGLDRLARTQSRMFGTTTAGAAAYSYDVLDNLTRVTVNTTDQLPGRDHYYCYDTSWRLTNVKTGSCGGTTVDGLGYDVQGNLDNRDGTLFDFDFGNRLRSVGDDDDLDSIASYVYDGLGRRVRDYTTDSKYSQYTQNGQLAMTGDGRAGIVAEYIYLGGSLVAIRERDTTTNIHTTKYQHTDALGSPVAVTDANRVVLERSEYEPLGKVLSATLEDGPGFTGHVLDKATGLNYMQQRYYDPQIGRFLSVDPVTASGSTGANFNRYWYANNNPYRFTDPDGRRARPGDRGAAYLGESISGVNVNSAESIGMANIPRSWMQHDSFWAQSRFNPETAVAQETKNKPVRSGSLLGKARASGTSAVGASYGLWGYMAGLLAGTNPTISFGNNAIQFENVPSWYMPSAMALGNTITYGVGYSPDALMESGRTLGFEEMQHTLQGEALGGFYLPAHLLFGTQAVIQNGDWHGPANILEAGPHSTSPRPWP